MSKIYLAQSDTTVGFLSSDDKRLAEAKQRDHSKKTLQTIDSFKELKNHTRVPKKYKNKIRRSKQTTFIYPNNESFRVLSQESDHFNFISKFHGLYSTSANKTQEKFDFEYAFNKADVVIFTKEKFQEKKSSKIFKLSKYKIKKIR